jgi:hypothetical protein
LKYFGLPLELYNEIPVLPFGDIASKLIVYFCPTVLEGSNCKLLEN